MVREEASAVLMAEPKVRGDFAESVIFKRVGSFLMPEMLSLDKDAAPLNVTLPLPTVTIRFLPLFLVEYSPPTTESVEVVLNPLIMSLPSPLA